MAWSNSLIWLTMSFVALIFGVLISNNRSFKVRPPGPPGWPVIGNILDIGTTPHQNLQKLQFKYGSVLWLKLGPLNTLVIMSAGAAAELFKKHDLPFSDRKVLDSLTAFGYNKGSLAMARYNDYSRYRRFLMTELLVQKRISVSASTRQKCIDSMIRWIKADANGGSNEIHLEKYLFLTTFNMVANTVISRDVMDSNFEKENQFFEAMSHFMEWVSKPNIVDSFPFLKWIDPQRIRKNSEKYVKELLKIIGGFVKERIQEKASGAERTTKDFLDACLEYEGDADKKTMFC